MSEYVTVELKGFDELEAEAQRQKQIADQIMAGEALWDAAKPLVDLIKSLVPEDKTGRQPAGILRDAIKILGYKMKGAQKEFLQIGVDPKAVYPEWHKRPGLTKKGNKRRDYQRKCKDVAFRLEYGGARGASKQPFMTPAFLSKCYSIGDSLGKSLCTILGIWDIPVTYTQKSKDSFDRAENWLNKD